MAKLGSILVAAIGWNNSHLHAFLIRDQRIGMCADDYPEGEIDEKRVSVIQALQNDQRVVFEYDFGDGWEHEVAIENLTWSYFGLKFAVCLDGENACPPDDVGGAYGYTEFLEAVTNPEHEEHGRVLEWGGGPFDPTEFDLANANALLQKVR
jgi:Plasmid pRiA4b ORF-3-like protein